MFQEFHASVAWGSLSDCSSWQPPPRWIWSPLPSQAQAQASVLPARIVQTHEASVEPCLATASNEAAVKDQPCVIASIGVDVESGPCYSTDSEQQRHLSTDLQHTPEQQDEAQLAHDRTLPPDRCGFQGNRTAIKHRAACHRLQVACTLSASQSLYPQTVRTYGKLV